MSVTNKYLHGLKGKPAERDSYSWADHLELLCIANIDGELSDADVIDRFSIRVRDLKEASKHEVEEEEELHSDEGEKASNRGRISDKWETKLRDWFSILSMRQALYGDFYPFKIIGQEMTLKNRLTLKHRLYIYLLLCSNLNLFSKQDSIKLTDSFEVLSLNAFKNILPKDAIIHLFGKNSLNKNGPFKGKTSLWKKINNLAELINESLTHKMNEVDYPANNTGDGGLDIVAWIPTNDKLSSKIIFFGQCACGEDWKKKQHESSYDDWSPRIELTNTPVNNIFIPYCYRQSNGEWHRASDIKRAFLLDRRRILEYCCRIKVLNYKGLPAYTLVNDVLKTKEDVI